jgi:hypothetical protein
MSSEKKGYWESGISDVKPKKIAQEAKNAQDKSKQNRHNEKSIHNGVNKHRLNF